MTHPPPAPSVREAVEYVRKQATWIAATDCMNMDIFYRVLEAAAERDALKEENAVLKSRLKWALQYGNFDAAKDNSTHAQILDEALKSLQQTGVKIVKGE